MTFTTDGMRNNEVRCDRCGMTQPFSACYQPGYQCSMGVGGSGAGVGRCNGTLRSRDQIAALMEAERAEQETRRLADEAAAADVMAAIGAIV